MDRLLHEDDWVILESRSYLTQLRVPRAREQLTDTRQPLYELANRVGYDSDIAFTKTFKKITGTTPTRYRREATP